jgi:hypothetical protein
VAPLYNFLYNKNKEFGISILNSHNILLVIYFDCNFLNTQAVLVSSEPLGLVFNPEAQTRRELVAERLNVEDRVLRGLVFL